MDVQNDRIIWVAYSWQLTAGPCAMCISVTSSDLADGRGGNRDRQALDPEVLHFPLAWDARAKPVPLPEPGMVAPLGLSGLGGFHPEAQSTLTARENEWLAQVKLIDQGFERLLADLLTGIVNGVAEWEPPFDSWRPEAGDGEPRRTHIVVQGPVFPKLLGRIGYRRICLRHPDLHLFFMTFRRRFLTPNPLLLEDTSTEGFPGVIHGPVPSEHEEAVVRKFYVLPPAADYEYRRQGKRPEKAGAGPDPEDTVRGVQRGDYPILVEVFCQGTDLATEKVVLAEFLEGVGLRHVQRPNGRAELEADPNRWWQHPHEAALRRVWVPRLLLEANRASLGRLEELVGGGKQRRSIPEGVLPFSHLKPILSFVQESQFPLSGAVNAVTAARETRDADCDVLDLFMEELRNDPDTALDQVRKAAMDGQTEDEDS